MDNSTVPTPTTQALRAVEGAIPARIRQGAEPIVYPYQGADDEPVFYRVRVDQPNGEKYIRPVSWNGEKYTLSEPRAHDLPLYNLPAILARSDEPVWIVEGEKCAEHLIGLGYLATTSGASSSANKYDWSALKGRECIIWPDNDQAGYKYAATVAEKLNHVSFVNVAALGLDEGGDAADYSGEIPLEHVVDDLMTASGGRWQPRAAANDSQAPGQGVPGWAHRALEHIPADVGRADWVRVGMAIHHADSSDAGFRIWADWSRQAEYPDQEQALTECWASFDEESTRPVTLGTLYRMAEGRGFEPGPGERIKYGIVARLRKLATDPDDTPGPSAETIEDNTEIDASKIGRIVDNVFWSPDKGKLMLVDRGSLIQAAEKDAADALGRKFGRIYNTDAAEAVDEWIDEAKRPGRKSVAAVVAAEIVSHVKYHNQRSRTAWRSDMFAESDGMAFDRFAAVVNLKHRPYPESGFDQRIVDDFAEHWPQFHEVVDWIVDARFASDRKHCYLWLKADSDFGKGLFTSTLAGLGAAASLDESEATKAAEGAPLGKEPQSFVTASAVIFNEITKITPAIKTLESEIELSTKYQLTSSVAVYAKILTSAYPINSLVTDAGVEDQLSNRFCYLEGQGSVKARPLFQEVGRSAYAASLRGFIAQAMNRRIAEYQRMGREMATAKADRRTDAFFERYQVSKTFGRVSDNAEAVAEDWVRWLSERVQTDRALSDKLALSTISVSGEDTHRLFLRSPQAWFRAYLDDAVASPARATLVQAQEAIFRAASFGGGGSKDYRVRGNDGKTKSAKGIPLKAIPEMERAA